ncbi:MAG: hypothetical protein J6B75_05790 [Ruminococcus sp.]|nr:hypothetical protein [Ruminococcus sp.]
MSENRLDKITYALDNRFRSKLSEVIDELVHEGVIQIYNGSEENDIDVNEKNAIYHTFKNPKKTGLLDRVEKYTGIRMDDFKKHGLREKSDMLCLIKYLYLVEYDFPLLKILSKPGLSDISIHSKKGDYNYKEELEKIAEGIRAKTPNEYADNCDKCYNEIAKDWMEIRSELLNLIVDAYFRENQKIGKIRQADREDFFRQLSSETGENMNSESVGKKALDIIKTTIPDNKNQSSINEEAEKLVTASSELSEEGTETEYDSFVETMRTYVEYADEAVTDLTSVYHNSFELNADSEIKEVLEYAGISQKTLRRTMYYDLKSAMQSLTALTSSFNIDELTDEEDYKISIDPYVMKYGENLDSFAENIRKVYERLVTQIRQIDDKDPIEEKIYSEINSLYHTLLESANAIIFAINDLIEKTDEERIKSIIQEAREETNVEAILDNIVDYLHQSISEFLNKIDRETISTLEYQDGVFGTFYGLINQYSVRCVFSNTDTVYANDTACRVSAIVQKFFSEYADRAVKFNTLDKMTKVLAGRAKKAEFEEAYAFSKIQSLVQSGVHNEITDADMRFAIKHLKTAIDWWLPDMRNEEYVNVIAAVTAMQELAYLYNTKLKYEYQYNGHDDKKTFSAIIAKPETADEMVKAILSSRLHYRFLVNIGGADCVEKLKDIRNMINDIVEALMLYHNFMDAQIASYFMYRHIRNIIMSISEPNVTEAQFLEMINSSTNNMKIVKIERSTLLTRLLHEGKATLQKLAGKIADQFNYYSERSESFVSVLKLNAEMGVTVFGDTENGLIRILQLSVINKEFEEKKLENLGLAKCLKEE